MDVGLSMSTKGLRKLNCQTASAADLLAAATFLEQNFKGLQREQNRILQQVIFTPKAKSADYSQMIDL